MAEEVKRVPKGRQVVILPDNDEPGRNHARQVANLLDGIADAVDASDALTAVQTAALHGTLPFAPLGQPAVFRASSRRCASVDGFFPHANIRVAAGDRLGLERLLRYAGRNPVAVSRMSLTADGGVAFRLKRPAPGGATTIVLTPLSLVRRVAALVPAPRRHQVRYAGVFAPGSGGRAKIVPPAPAELAPGAQTGVPAAPGMEARDRTEPPAGLARHTSAPADSAAASTRVPLHNCSWTSYPGNKSILLLHTDRPTAHRQDRPTDRLPTAVPHLETFDPGRRAGDLVGSD